MSRAYNFSAGPAVLPLEVLQDAQKDLVDYKGCGMSVMEMSHRGKDYDAIHQEAIATFKELCGLGDDWAVCFIQGGASMQFAMIPMNFLPKGGAADYAKQGTWSNKALKQAQMIGTVNVVANCQKDIPTRMPADDEFKWTPGAAYSHICLNETISGAEMKEIPETGSPLIGDMSSDILSCERDYSKFAMFYAGAQKNLGPSGMAVVAIRKEFAEKGSSMMVSDAGTGVTFCQAAMRGAAINVKVNTKLMKDRAHAEEMNRHVDELMAKYIPLADEVFESVYGRFN